MGNEEKEIYERHLKGINLRIIWTLIVCTAVSVSTVLSVYYGFKYELKIMSLRIDILQKQFDAFEKK